MKRLWSIRARTALAFALASMALTTAVIVFVNIAALGTIQQSVNDPEAGMVTVVPMPATTAQETPQPEDESSVAIVSVVALSQWQWSLIGIAVSGIIAGGLGWFISRRMLRPLDRIVYAAERISASTLNERIALDGPDDELRRLADTFDGLIARLEAAFESQRRFVAQASHELRTPLAVQRAAIQIGLHDDVDRQELIATREQLLEHNRASEHLIESLLTLAEVERGLDRRLDPVDLGEIASRVVDDLADAAAIAGVTVTVSDERASNLARGAVRAEPTLLRQLLINLVENAIEYNEPGGWVVLRLLPTSLRVENSGDVLAEEVVAVFTEPFRRATESRSVRRHSGLGLSIVAAIANAHGWALDLKPGAGGGLVVFLSVEVSPV